MFNLDLVNMEKALELHKETIIVDAHCDTILDVVEGKRDLGSRSQNGHSDLERMHAGGIGVQFFAAFIASEYKPERSLKRTIQIIDIFFREMEKNHHDIQFVKNYKDIEKAIRENKIAALLSVEGGECLEGDLSVLRVLYRLGVRSIGLTWNQRNEIADGVGEKCSGGITNFGHQVIKEMNNLGMLVDLAHINERGFWDAIECSEKPIIVSHANCYTLCKHLRNLNDKQILAIAKKDGVIGISFVPEFIGGTGDIYRFLDHIDYVAKIAGTDCIGLGSDFDGIDVTPKGLEDASKYPNITMGLIERGYTEREIKGILGGNILNLLKKVMK